jgi:choline-sulfatase
MKKGKVISAAFIVFCLVALGLWMLYSGKTFLQGDSIFLNEHLKNEYVIHSNLTAPLRSVERETLAAGWQRYATLGGVVVWRTFSNSMIISNSSEPDAHLFQDDVELKREQNVFRSDIQPDKWSFHENQIFITTSAIQDPAKAHYFLTYKTSPSPAFYTVSGEKLKNGQKWKDSNGKFTIYPLDHSLFIHNIRPLSPKIVIKKNGKPLPTSDWEWLTDSDIVLYRATPVWIFRIFGWASNFKKQLYLKGGLITFRIQARGEMAGSDFPLLGIYVDEKKVGTIEVKDKEITSYETDTVVQEGLHRIKLIFENDYFNPEKKEDRNIDISEISIEHKSAVLIRKSPRKWMASYTIDYATSNSDTYAYYRNFLNEKKANNQWIRSIETKISLADESRNSIVLAAGDQVAFPILLPAKPVLKFGYGIQHSKGNCRARIVVKLHRMFHFPITISLVELNDESDWNQKTVDLSRFSGKHVKLSFAVVPVDPIQSCPFLAFVSNPMIVSEESAQQFPQFVFLLSFDALRADHLGIYGHDRPISPNIDAFARDAVVFENAMTAATWTLPSFTSLFTSLYPDFHGVRKANQVLTSSIVTFPELLQRRGFLTAGFVDSPLLNPVYGLAHGFASYNYRLSPIEERCIPSLKWVEPPGTSSRFLFVHLISPHTPYTAPEQYLQRLVPDYKSRINMIDVQRLMSPTRGCTKISMEELDDLQLLYDSEVLQLDDIFQRYIRRMKDLGIYDDALIILMSDHGDEFMEHGNLFHAMNIFQETARVPLIMKFPKRFSNFRGVKIATPVHLIDVMPTILDFLKIQPPTGIQGLSLLELLSGNKKRFEERSIFTQNDGGILAIRHGYYKYIYTDQSAVRFNCRPMKTEELYDLQTDPGETTDLIGSRDDLVSFFRNQKRIYETQAAKFRNSRKSAQTIDLDQNVNEQIRALGYIQ